MCIFYVLIHIKLQINDSQILTEYKCTSHYHHHHESQIYTKSLHNTSSLSLRQLKIVPHIVGEKKHLKKTKLVSYRVT